MFRSLVEMVRLSPPLTLGNPDIAPTRVAGSTPVDELLARVESLLDQVAAKLKTAQIRSLQASAQQSQARLTQAEDSLRGQRRAESLLKDRLGASMEELRSAHLGAGQLQTALQQSQLQLEAAKQDARTLTAREVIANLTREGEARRSGPRNDESLRAPDRAQLLSEHGRVSWGT
jgi:uncharacterized phage infection (PIP) family protein YhgE